MSDESVIEMRPLEDSVRIAVSAEKLSNLQRELAQHTLDDKEFQVKIFTFLEKSIGELNDSVKEMNTKLSTVWDDMTLRKGKVHGMNTLGTLVNAFLTLFISIISAYLIVKYGR